MPSSIPSEHRAAAPQRLRCTVLTVSDTRTPETDRGGDRLAELLEEAGHHVVARAIVPDDPSRMREQLAAWQSELDPHAMLLTGGTGISPRDQTFETVSELITKQLPGYGELFRWLSYQEIGPAAMLSRAIGGLYDRTILLTMPGSPKAIELAMHKVILPELGHLVQQARK